MAVSDVFSRIKAHQVEGVMFHDQMRQYFDFLNLKGFKRMHEHHYKEESDSLVKTDSFYMSRANSFIPEYSVSTQSYIPQNWRSYRRQDVDATTKRRAVKDAMAKWVEWERQTKDLYSTSYKELLNDNAIDFAEFVKENLVLDVSEELAFAESLYMELENCDYDMVYLAEIQPDYSKKFKK